MSFIHFRTCKTIFRIINQSSPNRLALSNESTYDGIRWSMYTEVTFLSQTHRVGQHWFGHFQSELGLQNHRVQSPRYVILKIEDRLQKYFFSSKFYGLHLGGNYRCKKWANPASLTYWYNRKTWFSSKIRGSPERLPGPSMNQGELGLVNWTRTGCI